MIKWFVQIRAVTCSVVEMHEKVHYQAENNAFYERPRYLRNCLHATWSPWISVNQQLGPLYVTSLPAVQSEHVTALR